jgi:hypothetical protein
VRTRCLLPFLAVQALTAQSFTTALPAPGVAVASIRGAKLELGNRVLRASWDLNGGLRPATLQDLLHHRALPRCADAFTLILKQGLLKASELLPTGPARIESLPGDPKAVRAVERFPGKVLVLDLKSPDGALEATWRAVLRDGSAYLRQELALKALGRDAEIVSVRLVDLDLPGGHVEGSVKGSPIVSGNAFWAFEHPLSDSVVAQGRAVCRLDRQLPLKAGQSVSYRSVLGLAPQGQLRRALLAYVERERAHPYRPFLNYNSWYDIGYFSKYGETAALDVVNAYGRELVKARGVKLDSFLFDDGWDDSATLWGFHAGFPEGFSKVRAACEAIGAEPGVWMSPWGGYGPPKEARLSYGKQQGFETNDGGFALSGPRYYARFHQVCLDMLERQGVNQFKFDGTGNSDQVVKGSAFDSDFDAALSLIGDLRAKKPDLYINLTTGTYPSPFWLFTADSIWRGGEDHDFAGAGSWRQRWITYRDADTYQGIVQAGPLFPLNALMLHGLVYARHARHLDTDPGHDFADEVHGFFGTGTQLQELYITPSLLSSRDWDTLAEAARWARERAAVLVDTHWIGGDPRLLEVYGWASWSPSQAILVLRNPSDKAQSITVDPARAFELPAGAPKRWEGRSPWKADAARPVRTFEAGHATQVPLAPFEVRVLDLRPR